MSQDRDAFDESLRKAGVLAEIRKAHAEPKDLLAKGDVPGHEFHGNQYTDHGGGIETRNDGIYRDGNKGKIVGSVGEYHRVEFPMRVKGQPGTKAKSGATEVVLVPKVKKFNVGDLSKIHNPYKVHNRTQNKWRVVDDDGHQYGVHNTEAEADAQLAALYAAKEKE